MALSTRVRRLVVESPSSVGAKARARRWSLLGQMFPDFATYRVVDLGGTVDAWMRAPVRPAHVTVLNLTEPGVSDEPWITAVTGDAFNAVEALTEATGTARYDLVYSNAVLEHLGGFANRRRFADAVGELARRHWVQTPYRYFPVEPHWLFPGMQFLPVVARARIAATWPLSHSPARSFEEGRSSVLWTELIGISELRELFPDSIVLHERMAGLIKSIVAVTGAETSASGRGRLRHGARHDERRAPCSRQST